MTSLHTLAGQQHAARRSGHVARQWETAGFSYRLRIVRGSAVVERCRGGEGPWRRMPYPQALVDEMAALASGRQWREGPQIGITQLHDRGNAPGGI